MKIEKIYELTPLQKGILFHNVLDTDSVAYFEQATLYFYEDVNIDILRICLEMIQKRYEVLRTAIYYRIADCPKQVIFTDRELDFSCENLEHLSSKNCKKLINAYKEFDMKRGFDLEKNNLMRIKLFRESATKSTMIWSFHHIIVDGWSITIIMEKLISYYMRLMNGESYESILKEIEISQEPSFKKYVSELYSQDTEKGIQYWTKLLHDYSNVAEIPLIRKVDKSKDQVGEIESVLSEEFTNKLLKYSENNSVTVSHILEMAWGIVLQHFAGVDDVVFGKLVSGRNIQISGIERIVGMLMNTIPVRVKTEKNMTVGEMLANIKRESIESSKYDFCDLSVIQNRTKAKSKLIRSLYVYENVYIDNSYYDTLAKINIGNEELVDQVEYPIMFTGMMSGDSLKLYITYNPQYYYREEIEQVLQHLKTILCEILDNPFKKVESIPCFDEEEKDSFLICEKEFCNCNLDLWNKLCKKYLQDKEHSENIQFKILSKYGNVCGINRPGELCIVVNEKYDGVMKSQIINTHIVGRWNNMGQFETLEEVQFVNQTNNNGTEKKEGKKKNTNYRNENYKNDSLEKKLCGIYKECIGVEEYHLYDNFLLKGGDSITSLRIQARLKKEKIEVTLKDIFEKNIGEIVATIKGINQKKLG